MSAANDPQLQVRNFKMTPYAVVDNNFFRWKKNNFQQTTIEIGCGVGFHPIAYGKNNPDHGIVAIERTKTKYLAFARRLDNHDRPKNIYPYNGDALNWLPANVLPETVNKYFLLYPNPYPKAAQANKRWHRNPLMHKIKESLKPAGTIHFASNEKWLVDETLQYMQDYWGFALQDMQEVRGEIANPLTHFEKKYLKRGDTCYRLVFSK